MGVEKGSAWKNTGSPGHKSNKSLKSVEERGSERAPATVHATLLATWKRFSHRCKLMVVVIIALFFLCALEAIVGVLIAAGIVIAEVV